MSEYKIDVLLVKTAQITFLLMEELLTMFQETVTRTLVRPASNMVYHLAYKFSAYNICNQNKPAACMHLHAVQKTEDELSIASTNITKDFFL